MQRFCCDVPKWMGTQTAATWLHRSTAGSQGAAGRLHCLMDPLSEEQLMQEKEHLFFILNFCLQATNNMQSLFLEQTTLL